MLKDVENGEGGKLAGKLQVDNCFCIIILYGRLRSKYYYFI